MFSKIYKSGLYVNIGVMEITPYGSFLQLKQLQLFQRSKVNNVRS